MKLIKKNSRLSHQSAWLYLLLLLGVAGFNAQAEGLNIEFINKSNQVNPIYVLATGKNPVTHDACFIKVTNGVGECVKPHEGTNSEEFSYALSSLPNSTIKMPLLESGRIYLSVGHNVDMHVTRDVTNKITIVDPDGFKLRDSNYYVLYDKFEFSYVKGGLWVNPTAVDFFSLPISFNYRYPTNDTHSTSYQQVGLTESRSKVLSQIEAFFKTEDPSGVWMNALFIKDQKGQVIRLVSPGKAMVSDPKSQLNPGHYFPDDYLMNNKSGYDYTNELWRFYAKDTNNRVAIDLHELEQFRNDDINNPSHIFIGHTEGNDFVFTNGLNTYKLGKPTSSTSFFGGAGGPFDAVNGTPEAILVRQLTSAFEIGALPIEKGVPPRLTSTLLQFKNEEGKKITCRELKAKYSKSYPAVSCSGEDVPAFDYYTVNSTWRGTGPWYDLYSKALHSFGDKQPIYTFAYDDALGQDGTIHVPHGQVDKGSLKVTLGDMTGVTIPTFEESRVYSEAFLETGAGNKVYYTKSDGSEGGPLIGGGSQAVAPNVSIKVPFTARFCDDKGNERKATIYLNPAMIRPYVPGADGIVLNVSDLLRNNKPSVIFPGLPAGVSCNIK